MRFNPTITYQFPIQNNIQSIQLQNMLFRIGCRWMFDRRQNIPIPIPRHIQANILAVADRHIYLGNPNPNLVNIVTLDVNPFIRLQELKLSLLTHPIREESNEL